MANKASITNLMCILSSTLWCTSAKSFLSFVGKCKRKVRRNFPGGGTSAGGAGRKGKRSDSQQEVECQSSSDRSPKIVMDYIE